LRISASSSGGIPGPYEHETEPRITQITTDVLLAVFLAKPCQEDLIHIRDLAAAGRITPVIDRCYGLAEVAEAMRYQQGRHASGKVVIDLGGAAANPAV
jgi:NADPH:quinone reductase-like Zn-dependent oxidoreductase